MYTTRTIKEYQVPVTRPMARHLPSYAYEQQYMTPWGWRTYGQTCPQADILELDDQLLLEIALPGVVIDDVELKAEENCITVIAKRTPTLFEERGVFLRKELPSGFFVRQFQFEQPILHEQVEARMDRGILFVSVPKLEVAQRIPVSAGAIETALSGSRTHVVSKAESVRGSKEVTTVK